MFTLALRSISAGENVTWELPVDPTFTIVYLNLHIYTVVHSRLSCFYDNFSYTMCSVFRKKSSTKTVKSAEGETDKEKKKENVIEALKTRSYMANKVFP